MSELSLDDSVFSPDGDRWVPSSIAVGPWDPASLHGGPPTALVGRLMLDHEAGDTSWFLSRLTVELVKPVPLAPLKVEITLRRPGRRVQLLDAVVTAPDGTEVLWARGLRLAQSPNGIDEEALPAPRREPRPDPSSLPSWKLETGMGWRSFGEAYDFRLVSGAPFTELGPAVVWGRLKVPLLAGENIHPLDRVLTLADFPNGVGNSISFESFAYINPDLTVVLHRLPASEWVLLDAEMHARSTGHGSATGALEDEHGPLGTANQSLLITAR